MIYQAPKHRDGARTDRFAGRFTPQASDRLRTWLWVSAILVVGGVVTLTASIVARDETWAAAESRYRLLVDRVNLEVSRRIDKFLFGLLGTHGLFAASKSVERQEFTAYWQSRDLAEEFPGAMGVGYIQRVKRTDLDRFITEARADGCPDFQVKTSGDHPDLFIIKYIEPIDTNLPALGFDIGQEPRRREAAEYAMRTGRPAITAKIELVQDKKQQQGLLFLMPFYRNGSNPQNEQERIEHLEGWVYMPITVDGALADVIDVVDGMIDVEVFDGLTASSNKNLYDADRHLTGHSGDVTEANYDDRMFFSTLKIEKGGRIWTLNQSTAPAFEKYYSRTWATATAIIGSMLTLLLGELVRNMSTSRSRAMRLAHEMTQSLRTAKAQAETALHEVTALRNALDENSIISVADGRGRIIDVNSGFCEISGYHRDELIGQDHRIVNSGVHPKAFWIDVWRKIASGQAWRGEVCNRRKDGSLYWVDSTIIPFMGQDGRVDRFVSIRFDVTAQHQSAQQLASSEARFNRAVRGSSDGLWDWDLKTGKVWYSDRFMQLVERFEEDFPPQLESWTDLVHSEDRPVLAEAFELLLKHRVPLDEELRLRDRVGGYRWFRVRGQAERAEDGTPERMSGAITDIDDQRLMADELRQAARTDKLTGLPNRAMLLDRIQGAIIRAGQESDYHFAVMFLDFDRFKLINDSLGHQVGDDLLKGISQRLRSVLRSGDAIGYAPANSVAARLGGDEFVVLLDSLKSPSDAIVVGDRLLEAFSKPYLLGEHEVVSTASIGIVSSDQALGSADDVLRDADTAMYEAKVAGKGRYVVFGPDMRGKVQDRLSLENDLRHALELGQLSLHYQPIISLETGKVTCAEALMRWNHPTRGFVSPAVFIPIAEESNMILEYGQWALREACVQFMTWRQTLGDLAPQGISVNVSRRELLVPTFPSIVARILEQANMPASCLHLEITESEVMKDMTRAVAVLRSIKNIGVMVSMDDFGTGHSSLGCLRELPIDTLKLDRSFVATLSQGRAMAALLHSSVQLALNMNMKVIAEGVETADQVAILQSLECSHVQGFYFSRPLVAAQLTEYILAGPSHEGFRGRVNEAA